MITLAAVILLLPGCSSLTPASTEPTSTPQAQATPEAEGTASPAPDPTPTAAAPTTAPSDLSFEAGSALAEGDWDMGWGDAFASDPTFSVLSPDGGDGYYSYTDLTTQCELYFFQGSVTDMDRSQNDRVISDDFLATMLLGTVDGATREDVTAHAYDDSVFQHPGPGTAATRTIWGTSEGGGSWLHSTRMFGALGAGVYVGINCPAGQDAQGELNKLIEQYIRLIVAPM
ncbi:hypothetical protein [Microbacterium sp. P5_E9]